MSIPQINDVPQEVAAIVKHFPDEVVYEFTKHINKLTGIFNLSLVSQHFFRSSLTANFQYGKRFYRLIFLPLSKELYLICCQ